MRQPQTENNRNNESVRLSASYSVRVERHKRTNLNDSRTSAKPNQSKAHVIIKPLEYHGEIKAQKTKLWQTTGHHHFFAIGGGRVFYWFRNGIQLVLWLCFGLVGFCNGFSTSVVYMRLLILDMTLWVDFVGFSAYPFAKFGSRLLMWSFGWFL